MIRLIQRNHKGEIVSSYNLPQQGLRLQEIDDKSEEYKEWEKKISNKFPSPIPVQLEQ
jgi:hypothetical protein